MHHLSCPVALVLCGLLGLGFTVATLDPPPGAPWSLTLEAWAERGVAKPLQRMSEWGGDRRW